MKVCVIGIGYIGLPTACILNNNGFEVVGVDINEEYLLKIKSGDFYSKEKSLMQLVSNSLQNNFFSLKTVPEQADVFIICTPTPINEEKKPDLTNLINGINSVIPFLEKDNMIVIESTVPPKTTENIIKPIIERGGFKVGKDIFLAHCPERVIPGNIIHEMIYNNRIIGGCTEKCGEIIGDFYSQFILGEIIITKSYIAEMVKLLENTYRDVNIALVNEITIICNEMAIDPYEVINLANKHPRVNLLKPGIGVGGHCLPVDSYFIIDNALNNSKLIKTSRSVNDSIPKYIADKLIKLLKEINGSKIGIWGLAYKGNTDDLRNSPALEITEQLKLEGFNIHLYDPFIKNIGSENDKYNSIFQSDILLVLVNHDEFKDEDYFQICKLMNNPIIFDGVNILDRSELTKEVILYDLGNI